MPAAVSDTPDSWYSYAVIRVVPSIEREEFVNAGVVLFARTRSYLAARIELDEDRLRQLAPTIDLEEVRSHLAAFLVVANGDPAGGAIAAMSPSERFHWLTTPRSTVIQTSPTHLGVCDEPSIALEELMQRYVR